MKHYTETELRKFVNDKFDDESYVLQTFEAFFQGKMVGIKHIDEIYNVEKVVKKIELCQAEKELLQTILYNTYCEYDSPDEKQKKDDDYLLLLEFHKYVIKTIMDKLKEK